MKNKLLKTIISTSITGIFLATVSPIYAEVKHPLCNPSIDDYMSEYIEIDDKNMYDTYGAGMSNYKTYYGQSVSGHSVIFLNKICYNRFEFVLKDSNYEAVKERLFEIISEYYPLSDVKIEVEGLSIYVGKDESVSFKIGYTHLSNCRETVGQIIFAPNNSTFVSDEDKAKMNSIMQKLNEENLISKFYEAGQISKGQIFYVDDFGKSNFYEYLAEGIEDETLQSYIDKNNLDYTLQSYINEDDYMTYFRLVPAKETDFEEYFNIVTTIYKDLGYKPSNSTVYNTNYYYAKNALENNSVVSDIIIGDVNKSGTVDVRDCSFIAREIAGGKAADLPDSADYNKDGVKNIRDAATLAKELA